jgi:H+-transporting ATPase
MRSKKPAPSSKKTDDYASRPVAEALSHLEASAERGLSAQQASRRIAKFGYNEIPEKGESLWRRLFRRYWGPIPWMIEFAAILSAIVEKWDDFVIIAIMLLVNASLDFFQEHRALNALKALKQRLKAEAIALRDGAFTTIPARELVPGDIVKLHSGSIMPADVQLLGDGYLLVDQSSLTGESLPVDKQANDVAYASTIVKQGEMLAVVVNTGADTNFHTTVALVAKASLKERSHFQKMVIRIGNFLILITVALVLLIVAVGLLRHEYFMEIARFALVLAVASIPVALPAVLSVTMAVGAMNLARRKAVVSRLTAIEELAGVDVFCCDKTGTLTRNEMQAAEPVILRGHDVRELFLVAALASREEDRDPIEAPIFQYIDAKLPGLDWKSYRRLSFAPFDPIRKRTEAEVETDGERFIALKGAVQVLVEMSELPDKQIRDLNAAVDRLASKGYRTLAVARKDRYAPLEVLGLIPLYDPPREDSREVIADMQEHGVNVKMVTGDNIAIAREIGRVLGLEQQTMDSRQLSGAASNEMLTLASVLSAAIYKRLRPGASRKDAQRFANEVMNSVQSMYDTRLLEREFLYTHESAIVDMIEQVDIFAEVAPEDKHRIVSTLQKGGHIVGMTGDGVNDAPALKRADCGVAVSSATDAARSAADIILTAPGLGVINEAIRQARITFERMKSYSIFRIAETIRIILFMTFSIVAFNFYPMTPLMIILLALLNDIPILAIAVDRTKEDPKPVRWRMAEMLTVSTALGVTGLSGSFLLFFLLKDGGLPEPLIQSMLFLKLIVAGHSTLYVTRVDGWFWQRPWPALSLMAATFGTEILGTIVAVYGIMVTPIGWTYAMWMWGYALLWFIIDNAVKVWTYSILRPREKNRAAHSAV